MRDNEDWKHVSKERNRKERVDVLLNRTGRNLWPGEVKRVEVPKMTPSFWLRGLSRCEYLETWDTWGSDAINLERSTEYVLHKWWWTLSGEIKFAKNVKVKLYN